MDVLSLELAIYFVLPPLVLFVAAYFSADVLVLVAQTVIKRDVKRDTAVTAMAILIASTTIVSFLTYWKSQLISAAFIAAPTTFFIIGGITCARLLLEDDPNGSKHRFGPIGWKKGFLISALLSVFTIVPLAAVAWFTTQSG